MDAIGAVLDKIQGFLGKGFLVAGVFPVVVILLLSLPITLLVLPATPSLFRDFFGLPTGELALGTFAIAVVVALASFLVWTVNPWLRRILEGRVISLPWSKRWHQESARKLDDAMTKLRPDLYQYRDHIGGKKWEAELRAERAIGEQNGVADVGKANEAWGKVAGLRRQFDEVPSIAFGAVERVFADLRIILAQCAASKLVRLDQAQQDFLKLAQMVQAEAENEFSRLSSERALLYPAEINDVESTIVGNLAKVHGERTYKRFGIGIDQFWSGIEAQARKDAGYYPSLETAKWRLDFAVSMTAILALYVLFWMALLVCLRQGWLAFLAVALAGPLAVGLLYRICIWNAEAFYASVGATVELFRFDLLKSLHIDLPTTSDAEKTTWSSLTRLAELGEGTVQYKHS